MMVVSLERNLLDYLAHEFEVSLDKASADRIVLLFPEANPRFLNPVSPIF